jgi:hypothetical protein
MRRAFRCSHRADKAAEHEPVRCNPWLRQYYERLRAAGKPGKVAVIAAMRKLLTAVWSVATHRKPFVPHLPRVPAPLGAVTNKA